MITLKPMLLSLVIMALPLQIPKIILKPLIPNMRYYVGADNKYGHPHKEVISLMEDKGITVYRTDLDGTIVAISDGKEVYFKD